MYTSYIVKRTQIYLDEDQDAQLAHRARAVGATKSTLIREAIDAFLEGPDDEESRLGRFRTALEEIARAPLDLPDGRGYVEEVRAADVRRQERLERRRA